MARLGRKHHRKLAPVTVLSFTQLSALLSSMSCSILKAISSHACQSEHSLFRQSYFYIRDAQVKTQVLGPEHVNHEQETLTLDPS